MMTAKTRGNGLVVVFDESERERPAEESIRRDVRSIAHLKMLQSLSGKLSRLNDVGQIGLTISDELRLLIDYHNCRVFLRDEDDLVPLAFRGDLTGTTPGDPTRLLPTKVGRGITGRVAETGTSLLVDDAAQHEFGEQIEGTAEIEESLLAVPLKYGARVTGVIVISKLGLDQFDADDLRLLEVLAGHASVALENARLYEAQRREAESAKALLAFSRDLAEAADISDVAERVTRGAASILESPSTSVWLQGTDGALERLAIHPERAPDDPGVIRIPAEHIEPWFGRTEPYTVDPEDYAAISSVPRGTEGRFAIAPFLVDGRWGIVAAAITVRSTPEDRELELLASIARQTRLALQTATSYETLERTFLATVEALANALEANDEYTSTHARWITDLALQVGEELGFEPHELKRLELGALFHDIGKIGIPARILAKAGPLTADERALVETHPILGERILAPIEQLGEVRLIVRCAHEHYDGTGYPDHLVGDQIPLESRIVLACDAYHAMTTDRPYRRSLGEDEAKRRLVEASGTQFDPQVVDALLRVLDASLGPGGLGVAEPAERPHPEEEPEADGDRERGADVRCVARDEPATGLEEVRHRIDGRDALDPAVEQLERNVDRREEQDQEHRHLHERRGLDRAEPHRDPAGPEEAAEIHESGERVQAEEIDGSSTDVHADGERDHGEHHRDEQPADERRERVAHDDPAAVGRREHEPLREAALEVARDAEPREDAAEGRRLQEHEHELERRVTRREVEARVPAPPGTGRLRTRRRRTAGTSSSAGGSAGWSARS